MAFSPNNSVSSLTVWPQAMSDASLCPPSRFFSNHFAKNSLMESRTSGSINPTVASLSFNFGATPVSHAVVLRKSGYPLSFAVSNASTCRQMLSALLRSSLPSRVVFRLLSGATNWIPRRPFGSSITDAIASDRSGVREGSDPTRS